MKKNSNRRRAHKDYKNIYLILLLLLLHAFSTDRFFSFSFSLSSSQGEAQWKLIQKDGNQICMWCYLFLFYVLESISIQ